MRMQSHLGRARNLGSSNAGTSPWWIQRMTSIALVPLSIWFIFFVISIMSGGGTYEAYQAELSKHGNLVMLSLFVIVAFHHAQQGMCEIYMEYIHNHKLEIALNIGTKFVAVVLGFASFTAVYRVAFGG